MMTQAFACWTYNLYEALLIISVSSFTNTLDLFETVFEKVVFNAPVNGYIPASFRTKTPPQIFILWEFHNSSFNTACFAIYFESLDGMLLLTALVEFYPSPQSSLEGFA